MTWVMLLVACNRMPEITSVSPAEARPGEPVRLIGERFAAGDVAGLRLGESPDVRSLLDQVVAGATLIEGTVPAELTPGIYDVVLTRGSREVTFPLGLDLVAEPEELPCSPDFTANTELSLARKEIVIDRYYRSGDRETVHLPLGDIERVEYERIVLPDGGKCSAIFMRTVEGRRVVFVDDDEIDLKERAYKLARDMGKSVEVTRDDAVASPDEE